MPEGAREALLLAALQNAVKHGDVPKPGAVLGIVMGKHPELRARAKEVQALAAEVIAEVGAMTADERRARLEALAPEVIAAMGEKHEKKRALPPLERAENGIVMRFAPNPSGPLHLGHARAAVLNDEYVKQYGGRYILRIEDTDPKRVDPEAYAMVPDDLKWLGIGITETVYQSDRFPIYYEYGRNLIELGGAYVCTCENEHFRELKMAKAPCLCRDLSVEENLARWEKMLDGGYREGEASVRVRTDLSHPDPAMRDYPAFRILDSVPHPRKEGTRVYPLMNFSVTVDDHLLGITHVIRGKDHIANTRRQRYIFDYFGWEVPVYRHYGRMGIEGVVLSTSQMRLGIREGTYTGWDDIHLGTLRALARRGIRPDAVKNAMLDIGIGETDISFSWDNLFARNKEIIDPLANRYFFVPDPVPLEISGAPKQVATVALYPGDAARGNRILPFTGTVVLPKSELTRDHAMMRLKDLFNVNVAWDGNAPHLSYAGDSLADARAAKAPIIQWLPAGDASLPCTLVHPEGSMQGVCESAVALLEGNEVQFERIGFARIDSAQAGKVVAYFTHR